jgi:hypothetical protein
MRHFRARRGLFVTTSAAIDARPAVASNQVDIRHSLGAEMTTAPSDPKDLNSPTDLDDRASDESTANAVAPGWYADPSGSGVPRWWDGTAWTAHVAPGHEVPVSPGTAPPAADSHYTVHGYSQVQAHPDAAAVVPSDDPKSVWVAFLLTLFFGPLGMFYSTVNGALIMTGALFVGAAVVFLVTLGIGVLVWVPAVWIVSIIWGCTAAHEQSRPQVRGGQAG